MNALLIMANRRFALAIINDETSVHCPPTLPITNSGQWLIIHKVKVFIKMALANLHSFTFRYVKTE